MSAAPISTGLLHEGQALLAPLRRLRLRCRVYALLDGSVRLVLALILAALCQLSLDRWMRLSLDQRAALNLAITLFWLWVAYRRLLAPLLSPLSDRRLAHAVDRLHPELHDQIASAVQFSQGAVGDQRVNSPQLVRAVVLEACRAARSVSFLGVLNHRRAARRAVELLTLLASVPVVWTLMPDLMNTWFRRNWLVQEIPWPQATYLHPVGFDLDGRRRFPLGDELQLEAEIAGEKPATATLIWWTPSGRQGREEMALVGGRRLRAALGVITENLSFRLVGGDEYSRIYTVEAVARPRVMRTMVRITPPEYTGLEPETLEQQTSLELIAGTEVIIEVWTNKPVANASFVNSAGPAAEITRDAADRLLVRLSRPQSGAYWFELSDADGWEDLRPVRFLVRIKPDEAPGVQLRAADVGEFTTPTAAFAVDLLMRDAYGLGLVELSLQKNDEPPLVLPLDGFRPGARVFETQVTLSIALARAAPGDRLRLSARAADQDPHGPNQATADPIELTVLSPEDFLSELARRETELRREFERLISAQRSLKDTLVRELNELPPAGRPAPAAAQRLTGLARRQESQAGRCLQIRDQFERILREMRSVQVARRGDEVRLTDRIATPLDQLGRDRMRNAAADIAAAGGGDAIEASRAGDAQDEILTEMRRILANMLEWEGYREAVALLQEIIGQQQNVQSETLKALEGELNAILGLEPPTKEDSREPPPQP